MKMETFGQKIEKEIKKEYKNEVHWILAHSYSFFLLMFLIGIFFDIVTPIDVFKSSIVKPMGFVLLALASVLIFWSQKTSRHMKKDNITKETFKKGPYLISRSPTHWGLFFALLGFGFAANASFTIICSILAMLITKMVFLRKEEKLLKNKYGEPYSEYKKSVKL